MSIPDDLLEILACPVCREPVRLTATEDGLQCGRCRRVYPIRDEIPVLLVEEAVEAPADDPAGGA